MKKLSGDFGGGRFLFCVVGFLVSSVGVLVSH